MCTSWSDLRSFANTKEILEFLSHFFYPTDILYLELTDRAKNVRDCHTYYELDFPGLFSSNFYFFSSGQVDKWYSRGFGNP